MRSTVRTLIFIIFIAIPVRADEKTCLSAKCHGALAQEKVVHPPVKDAACEVCHTEDAPLGPFKGHPKYKLTMPTLKETCAICHGVKDDKKVVHAPVKDGSCTACHNPHSSPNERLLIMPMPDMCFLCHPTISDLSTKSLVKHGALNPTLNPRLCNACHDPHTSDYTARLRAGPPSAVCFQCHNKELTTPYGKIMNMKAWVERFPEKDRHGPVKMGACTDCHSVHGSNNWRVLKAAYPQEVYAAYTPDVYALCFQCHDEKVFSDSKNTKTGFRNGTLNLHAKHVNRPFKGRTCRLCHDVHASPNPHHIKVMVNFGRWAFPLYYKVTSTGGSCAPACHRPVRYDRTAAVKNR